MPKLYFEQNYRVQIIKNSAPFSSSTQFYKYIKSPDLTADRFEDSFCCCGCLCFGRCLRPTLYAHTAQALGARLVSAAIVNAKRCPLRLSNLPAGRQVREPQHDTVHAFVYPSAKDISRRCSKSPTSNDYAIDISFIPSINNLSACSSFSYTAGYLII